MGIIAAGQITVVDLSDAPVLNTFITASRPTTQTYSKDSGSYNPSYASTPQVLTLKLTKAGSTANIIDSISSLHWFVVDGPVKTEITSKDNTANEYISGTHNEVLTTKLDIDISKGSKRYEVMGIWPDPSTGLDVQFGGYIDLLLTQNGATGPQGPQGDTGNGIANTVITYGLSMSDTTEPATWSSDRPALVKGMYLWTRTVIIYTNGESTTSYQISYIPQDADASAEIDKTKQELLEKLETVRDDSLAAVEDAKQQLVTVRDESLAAAEEAKQGLANVTSELNTAKQELADSVTAVNNKADSAKAEVMQAKQQLTTVADDLSKAKTDFQNAVSAVDTKATNLKNDLTQAKQDLASQAQQLQEQATAQSELTNRVSSVEETANGTKTTVSELSKTVAQNGKDITSVTARTKVVEDDLAGTKTTLSQVQTTANSTSQKTATLETGLNGLSAKFNSLSVGNKNYLPASRVVNRGCSNFSYSNTTKSWTMTVPASSSGFGNGITFNTNGLNILLNGGETLFFGLMIKANKACSFNYDVNNALSGTTSNDNDDTSKRAHSPSNKSIPANVWTKVWFSYTAKANVPITENKSNFGIVNNTEPVTIEIKEVMVAKSNVPVDYQTPDAELEQKVAEYKQNADQNYASLQTTVQNLDGTVQHNKTVADQTAQGFTTRIESLETYKDGETTRANQYFESAKTETARQLTAERTAIAKDYVAKSTYTSDVTGIRNDLSATTTTANTTKTNLANYQASNDRAVANLQSNLQTANGNISSLQTKVEAVPGQITSAVSAVEGKIPKSAGGRNLALGTSADWNAGLTSFNGQNNQVSIIYRIYNRGFKVGDKVNVRLVLKYSDIVAADGQTARILPQTKGNVTQWSSGIIAVGQTIVLSSQSDEIVLTASTIITENHLQNEYWEWRLRVDYVKSGKIQWKEAKVEVGDLPTPWSPAPEDTVSQISNLSSEIKQTADGMTLLATKTELNSAKNELQSGINTATNKANSAQSTANSNAQTISTHTNQISALNTGLQAKVSQTDFNTLSGRVTTAENNITAKANELSSKITSVEGKIPTEIGSSNLLRKTAVNADNLKLFGKTDTTVNVVEKDGHQVYKLVVSGSSNAGAYFNGNDNYYNLVKDRNYTFSFWVLTNKDKNFNMKSLGHIQAVNNNGDIVGSDRLHQHTAPVYSTNTIKANTWTKVWCTFKATSNSYFKPYFWYLTAGDEIYIYDMMLNEGKVPLSYTPALEDTATEISSLSSELKQTKDGITLLATKTELNNAKNELQSGINTATNKANNNAQTISTHTNQISALNTGLQAKVSQTEFNTLSGRVTSAENNITAKANELSSKITSVEGKVPTNVSTRNLILKSNDFTNPHKQNGANTTVTSTNDYFVIRSTGYTNNAWGGMSWNMSISEVKAGEEFSILMPVYIDSSVNLDSAFSFELKRHDPNTRAYAYSIPTNKKDQWFNVAITFKIARDVTFANYPFYVYLAKNGLVRIKPPMLVRGNLIPSDYQPAFEDTATQISSLSSELKQTKDGITLLATKTELNTAKNELQSGITTATNKANVAQSTANNNAQTISTHTTQISALNTGLQAKVSQTDFNTLSGRVTTAENNITAKANELSSKITSVEGKIPTSIGSTNLLLYSADPWKAPSDYYQFNGVTKTDNTLNGSVVYKTSGAWNSLRSNWGKHLIDRKNVKVGDEFTYSIYAKTDQASIRTRLFIRFSGQSSAEALSSEIALTNEWKKLSVTFKVTQKMVASQTKLSWVGFEQTSNSENGKFVYYACNKLERGNISTDWSPAPEDAISQINAVSSELKQTKDGITLLATKTELSTAKNELQSGINTATNKANNNAQTISTHTNQISALNSGLQAKVSQTDFNTLSGRVTTAENNITAKANELSSKITSVEGKIPTSSGGRNLAQKTSKDWSTPFTRFSGIENTCPNLYKILVDGLSVGDTLKTRIVLKYTDIIPASGKTARIRMQGDGNVTGWGDGSYDISTWKTISGSGEVVFEHEFTIRANHLKNDYWNWAFRTDWIASGSLQWRLAKVERGMFFTDWSPAPEDTAEQISNLSSEIKQTADGITLLATKTELNTAKNELQSGINTATNKANNAQNTANNNAQTISTHTNQISALNTGLNAKVSQTDFNTLSGRVTTAENNITAKANELSSKITSVEGKIPTEIGSSNLLRNTAVNAENLKLFGKTDTTVSVVEKDRHQVYKLVVSGSSNAGAYFNGNDNYYNLVKDRNYTFSFWVLTNKDKNFNMKSLGHIQAVNNNGDIVGSDRLHQHTAPVYSTNTIKANTWTKVWCTFKATSNSYFKPYFWYLNSGDEIYIYDMMINEGKVPLSYTPAPEDTISQINAVSSELKQTKDGITLLATKTELSTAKNELQSGINTATNKANSAQSTANSNAQTISTHTNQISALNTGLNAKVSQTDFNTLSGRVTTAENNITAKANELSSKITSVEGKIPTNVSTRNLILKSNDFAKPHKQSGANTTVTSTDGYFVVKSTGYTANAWGGMSWNMSISEVKAGEQFSILMPVYIDSSVPLDNGWAFTIKNHPSNSAAYSYNIPTNKKDQWFNVAITFKASKDVVLDTYPFYVYLAKNGLVRIKPPMLVRGSLIPSDYQPAFEDAVKQINSLSSELKQTTDAIKASVTSLDKSTVKSSSLTINSDGIVMKAGKSTTDVANAIGSYFAVNQNAIDLFADKIKVKGNMIVNGTITGDKIKASSVDVSKIVGIDANFIKSKIEHAMIDWLKGKTITAYNDNMTIDLQNGRISFKDGTNAVYRQTPDGIHTGFLHFDAGSLGGIYAAFGATSTRHGINSRSSAFAGIRCYRVSKNGASHEAKIDKVEIVGDTVQFGHGYTSDGSIAMGGGFIMDNAAFANETPYSLNRVVKSIESLWRILHDHAKNTGYRFNDQAFINALNNEYNAWHELHNM